VTLANLKASLCKPAPPKGLAPALQALWWAAKDDWDKAHRLVQDEGDRNAAWVHAYLHRAEGDLENARYWYRQARRPEAKSSLEREWEAIAMALLRARTSTPK
jgi:hypothetical protein